MSITAAANTLILNSTIAVSIDNIDVISIYTTAEIFRKVPQSIETISATERRYIFYLTEMEGNGNITSLSLYGGTATATLGTGTQLCTQVVDIVKTSTKSLLVTWTAKVV